MQRLRVDAGRRWESAGRFLSRGPGGSTGAEHRGLALRGPPADEWMGWDGCVGVFCLQNRTKDQQDQLSPACS